MLKTIPVRPANGTYVPIRQPVYTPEELQVIKEADRITFHSYSGRGDATIVAAFEIKNNNGRRMVKEALAYAQDIRSQYGERLVINLSAPLRFGRRYVSMPVNYIPEVVQ